MENQEGSEMTYESRLAKWKRVNSYIFVAFAFAFVGSTFSTEWEWWGLLLGGTFGLLWGIHCFFEPLPSGSDAGDGDKRKRNLVALFYTIVALFLLAMSLASLFEVVPPF